MLINKLPKSKSDTRIILAMLTADYLARGGIIKR